MPKIAGACRFGDCRTIGQARPMPYPPTEWAASNPTLPRVLPQFVEICGTHWPEVRAKTADRAHWLAVVRDGDLSFDAVPSQR